MAVFLVHPSFISILEQFAELRERERGEGSSTQGGPLSVPALSETPSQPFKFKFMEVGLGRAGQLREEQECN